MTRIFPPPLIVVFLLGGRGGKLYFLLDISYPHRQFLLSLSTTKPILQKGQDKLTGEKRQEM